ncbi:TPA: sodium:proton antiporter, partial [Candidatus Poribacteria bacterium]|nr:sodium:proton antiporter [Candidatus Poribacteria bacterium]
LPSLILIFAWGLKEVCDALRTGDFLGATVSNVISPVWFPTIIFVVAALTSFATGTSWGTMAILIPIATPIAFGLDGSTYGITTIICLGAVLDGSIFGDHCSPISDTTIMSSISCSCDHIHHVRTQLPYSLTVAGLAIIFGYLPATFRFPPWFLITCATGVIVLIFLFVAKPVSGSR